MCLNALVCYFCEYYQYLIVGQHNMNVPFNFHLVTITSLSYVPGQAYLICLSSRYIESWPTPLVVVPKCIPSTCVLIL